MQYFILVEVEIRKNSYVIKLLHNSRTHMDKNRLKCSANIFLKMNCLLMSKADLLCEKAVKPIPLTYSILLHIFRSIKFCKVFASLCKKCVKWWVRIPSWFQSYIKISLYKKVLNISSFLDIKRAVYGVWVYYKCYF